MAENEAQLIDFDAYVKELEAESSPGPGPDVLLLTCIDFRFFKKIADIMGNVKYDHLILAGAALGAVIPEKQATWGVTFTDHVKVARALHRNITKFIVMEHRECGAYGPKPGFGLLPAKPNIIDETRVHIVQVMNLYLKMALSGLKFDFLLLSVPPDTNTIRCERVDLKELPEKQ